MRRRVYRSLDRPATFFGIRGRFILVLGAGAGAAVCIGIIVGSMTSMLFGFGALLLVMVIAYFFTTSLQSKIDEKDIWKSVTRKGYPSMYRVRPKHIRNIWKGFNLVNSNFLKE